jgi:hypothetical protein
MTDACTFPLLCVCVQSAGVVMRLLPVETRGRPLSDDAGGAEGVEGEEEECHGGGGGERQGLLRRGGGGSGADNVEMVRR